jgi:hypothetical protein
VTSSLAELVGDSGERVLALLAGQQLRAFGLSFGRDLGGWIGPTVAVVVVQASSRGVPTPGSNVALILPARNRSLARKQLIGAISRLPGGTAVPARFGTLQYWYDPTSQTSLALIGNYAIFGGQTAIEDAVTAARSESLASTPEYRRGPSMSSDNVLRAYYDPHALGKLFANYLYDLNGPFVLNDTKFSCAAGCTRKNWVRHLIQTSKPQSQMLDAERKRIGSQLPQYPPGSLYSVSVVRSHRHLIATFVPSQVGSEFASAARSALASIFGGSRPVLVPSSG